MQMTGSLTKYFLPIWSFLITLIVLKFYSTDDIVATDFPTASFHLHKVHLYADQSYISPWSVLFLHPDAIKHPSEQNYTSHVEPWSESALTFSTIVGSNHTGQSLLPMCFQTHKTVAR